MKEMEPSCIIQNRFNNCMKITRREYVFSFCQIILQDCLKNYTNLKFFIVTASVYLKRDHEN